MIGLKGTLNVIDNSGALVAECINVLKNKSSRGMASVGDEIVVVINRARPISLVTGINSSTSGAAQGTSNIQKVRRGDVRRAVVVRTRFPVRRADGRYAKFDDNACILLSPKGEMIGTRVNGLVSAELRDVQGGKGGAGAAAGGRWGKILGLAGKVV